MLAAGTNAAALGGWGTAVGVGVIMGAALLCVLLVPRWHAEWLVYLAQASVLLAYVDYRLAFPQSMAFDAIVLTLLGYLDLGIAEVLERLDAQDLRPARAVLFADAARPAAPAVGRPRRTGRDQPVSSCWPRGHFTESPADRLRWKTLGYAAAVLYNAALWVLWSRLGWTAVDAPSVLPGAGRTFDDSVRRGQPQRAGPIERQHDPHGRAHDHLPVAGRAHVAVRELWRWVALLLGSLVGFSWGSACGSRHFSGWG